MKPLPPMCVALAVLALAACEDPQPLPQPQPQPQPSETFAEIFANATFGYAGECTHADVLAIVAEEAGIPVDQAGEPVLAAVRGLPGHVRCPDAVGKAMEALERRNARTPQPRTPPPRPAAAVLDDATRFVIRNAHLLR